jgi:hypothetical protein
MITRLIYFAVVTACLVLGANQANAQATIYGTYYDETVLGINCTNPSIVTCRVNFSQTPSDNLVMISEVSCYNSSTKQPYALALHVAATSGGDPISRELFIDYAPPLISTFALYAGAIHKNVQWLIGQGRYPYVEISYGSVSNNATVRCTIVGSVVTPIS